VGNVSLWLLITGCWNRVCFWFFCLDVLSCFSGWLVGLCFCGVGESYCCVCFFFCQHSFKFVGESNFNGFFDKSCLHISVSGERFVLDVFDCRNWGGGRALSTV